MSAQSNLKLLGSVVGALCFGLAGAINAPAMAGLVGTGTYTKGPGS